MNPICPPLTPGTMTLNSSALLKTGFPNSKDNIILVILNILAKLQALSRIHLEDKSDSTGANPDSSQRINPWCNCNQLQH